MSQNVTFTPEVLAICHNLVLALAQLGEPFLELLIFFVFVYFSVLFEQLALGTPEAGT